MTKEKWQGILIPPGDQNACWELFHENSKSSRFDPPQDTDVLREEMVRFHEVLQYDNYRQIDLPKKIPALGRALGDAICSRRSVRKLRQLVLVLESLAAILYYSYGLTGGNPGMPRAFRAVPSAGALHPLELYLYCANVGGLDSGIYHYNPCVHRLSFLKRLQTSHPISQAVRQPELVSNASMIVFITALFERTVFKYRDRGYRFALLEAGHVAQNMQLVLEGMDLSGVGIGGFFDREIDKLLGLDGLTQSTLYMIALGGNSDGANK